MTKVPKYYTDANGNIYDLAHRVEKLWNEIEAENEPEQELVGILTKEDILEGMKRLEDNNGTRGEAHKYCPWCGMRRDF